MATPGALPLLPVAADTARRAAAAAAGGEQVVAPAPVVADTAAPAWLVSTVDVAVVVVAAVAVNFPVAVSTAAGELAWVGIDIVAAAERLAAVEAAAVAVAAAES